MILQSGIAARKKSEEAKSRNEVILGFDILIDIFGMIGLYLSE